MKAKRIHIFVPIGFRNSDGVAMTDSIDGEEISKTPFPTYEDACDAGEAWVRSQYAIAQKMTGEKTIPSQQEIREGRVCVWFEIKKRTVLGQVLTLVEETSAA